MPAALNAIATRQDAEVLFQRDAPLGAAASFISPVRRVEGYFAVNLLAISDQSFSIVVEEGCLGTGPFVQTATYTSSLVLGVQRVCVQHFPCGSFMRTTLGNLGPAQGFLSYCGLGLPEP
jgi:hypothetical protein